MTIILESQKPKPRPNWQGFTQEFVTSEVFVKLGNTTNSAQYTNLVMNLQTMQSLALLRQQLTLIRNGLYVDLTQADLNAIEQLITKHNLT